MTTAVLSTAKVFTTGRSQAVRLPKAFRFDTAEVTIEKVGDAVVLRPKHETKGEWWAKMEAAMDGLKGMELVERDPSLPREIEPFDLPTDGVGK